MVYREDSRFDPKPFVYQTLDMYADGGDVQTCITMAMVLGTKKYSQKIQEKILLLLLESYLIFLNFSFLTKNKEKKEKKKEKKRK